MAAGFATGRRVGRLLQLGVVSLLACAALGALPAAAAAETTPPSLTGLVVSPTVVDTGQSAQDVRVVVSATDDSSGIRVVRASFAAPAGLQFGSSFFGAPTSGTATNGTWDFAVTLPQYSPQGTYELTLELEDQDGNVLRLTPADLASRGFTNQIVQLSPGDALAPTLASLTAAPLTVDASTADQPVLLTVAATDLLAGVDQIRATLSGPGATVIADGTSGNPDSGTRNDGVWTFSLTIPQGSPTGTYALSLELSDTVGNTAQASSADLALAGFPAAIQNVDATPPALRIDNGPSGLTRNATPTFGFTAEPGAALLCSVDQGTAAFGSCSSASTHTPSGPLADGPWTFRVKAVDTAGNLSIATRSFVVDTIAPDTAIDSGPSGLIDSTSATFAFSSLDPLASFECRLGPTWQPCSSPKSYSDLADGGHTFDVRAIDLAGNVDPSPASRAFTVDTEPPLLEILSGPSAATNDPQPTFEFRAEAGAQLECAIDQGAASFGPCATATSHRPDGPLGDGSWTFRVRATDAAGHTATATRSFSVDTSVPETTILSGPKGKLRKTKAEFTFMADGASGFECALDGGAWKPCSSPVTYKKLRKGRHVFAVRAVNAAGAADPSPASRNFKVVPRK